MPMSSITAAATTLKATNPERVDAPTRNAAEPPAVPMSARACPAKDCPRMTVNTPTIPDTTAAMAPTVRAT
jgi:hypothetical protein